ncbi:MAG: DUF3108 domain-containing protein [Deltaproteobacteria bacterium]|nr:DUF3108 domain-containing protein [Deltaproteobacteria bacterium]
MRIAFFLKTTVLLLLLSLAGYPLNLRVADASPLNPRPLEPLNPVFNPVSIGERFQGEVLKYDFGFWIFSKVGEGSVTFQSLGHGKYFAAHDGQTVGVVGWITRYRKDVYRSTMTTVNNGRRLIPLRFEEDVIIGTRGGKTVQEEIEIPEGLLYDDPMTAFYNFRFGVYGKVEPGKKFIIPAVPRKGKEKAIRLAVASREEAEKRRATEEEKGSKDLFITVQIDPELVGSLRGLVEAWFSSDVVPVSGLAKGVILFGDIRGKLTHPQSSGK